jgi:peroxiredoxin
MVSTVSKSGLQVGDPVSDITLPTVAGGEVNLRGFHGKRFILFMWASW